MQIDNSVTKLTETRRARQFSTYSFIEDPRAFKNVALKKFCKARFSLTFLVYVLYCLNLCCRFAVLALENTLAQQMMIKNLAWIFFLHFVSFFNGITHQALNTHCLAIKSKKLIAKLCCLSSVFMIPRSWNFCEN